LRGYTDIRSPRKAERMGSGEMGERGGEGAKPNSNRCQLDPPKRGWGPALPFKVPSRLALKTF